MSVDRVLFYEHRSSTVWIVRAENCSASSSNMSTGLVASDLLRATRVRSYSRLFIAIWQ